MQKNEFKNLFPSRRYSSLKLEFLCKPIFTLYIWACWQALYKCLKWKDEKTTGSTSPGLLSNDNLADLFRTIRSCFQLNLKFRFSTPDNPSGHNRMHSLNTCNQSSHKQRNQCNQIIARCYINLRWYFFYELKCPPKAHDERPYIKPISPFVTWSATQKPAYHNSDDTSAPPQ